MALDLADVLGVMLGSIAIIWHVISWWIGRTPRPVIKLQSKKHLGPEGAPLYEIFMTVTNKGHRTLKLSEAKFMILNVTPLELKVNASFFKIKESNKIEESLVEFKSLPHLTKNIGTFIDPEDSETEVIVFRNPPKGIYKVKFEVTVEKLHFFVRWRPKKLFKLYSKVDLFVVT